jgi:hypothetical protein
MHTWMAVMVILLLTGVLAADVVAGRGRGDSRRDGTYVQPHQRTTPDGHLSPMIVSPDMTIRTLAS